MCNNCMDLHCSVCISVVPHEHPSNELADIDKCTLKSFTREALLANNKMHQKILEIKQTQ
jgi:hypothetical protein